MDPHMIWGVVIDKTSHAV